MSPLSKARPIAPLTPSVLPRVVHVIGEFCASHNIGAYLVGGAVRDLLLGRPVHDVDIGVQGDTLAIGRKLAQLLGGKLVTLDAGRGIVRIVFADGNAATEVDLTPVDRGIAEDLERRDFALDAMAVPMGDALTRDWDAELIDPYDGLSDLREGVVRVVGPSALRDDAARLMRAPRLAAQLGFRIEGETAAAIRSHAHLVDGVAPERVRDELMKLLGGPSAAASLRLLDDLTLLCRVVPELAESRGVVQPPEHHWDVLDHCIETAGQVERVVGPPAEAVGDHEAVVPRFEGLGEHFGREAGDGHTRLTVLKLAGLLHDVAKPATRTVEESGRIRFLGHHTRGAEICAKILARLRYSRRVTDMVSRMVENHLRPGQMAQKGELPTPRAVYRYYRDLGDVAVDTLYLNMADYLAARGPALEPEEWAEYCRTIEHILSSDLTRREPESDRTLMNGHEIMAALSIGPGPHIGALLEMVREAEASGEIDTKEQALMLVGERVAEEGRGA